MNSITSLGSANVPINDMCLNNSESKLYLAGSDAAIKILDMNIDISETKIAAH